jgi:hypothetical protein
VKVPVTVIVPLDEEFIAEKNFIQTGVKAAVVEDHCKSAKSLGIHSII